MNRFVFVILFAWILSACGPTPEDIAAQTADAATATFEALPTATPTITLTYTPKVTPTATMTFTPTMDIHTYNNAHSHNRQDRRQSISHGC